MTVEDSSEFYTELEEKESEKVEMSSGNLSGQAAKHVIFYEEELDHRCMTRSIPAIRKPKPHFIPDYKIKYPPISTAKQRECYKAVFNDQYTEYKELYEDVFNALAKFKELDVMLEKLHHHTENQQENERIRSIMQDYRKKKTCPIFLEKRERCDYLKKKLTHIKQQIQEYDTRTKKDESGAAAF